MSAPTLGLADGGVADAGRADSGPGSIVWTRAFDSSASTAPGALAVAPNGELFLAAAFGTGTAELGGELFLNLGAEGVSDTDLAFGAFAADGGTLWSKKVGGTAVELSAHGAVSLPSGERWVAGAATAPWRVTEEPVPAGGFVTALSPQGDARWTISTESSADALNASAQGDVLVASHSTSLVLRSLDSTGQVKWTRTFPASAQVNAITQGPDGAWWVAGHYSGQLDWGGVVLPNAKQAPFIARLSAEGSPRGALAFSGENASILALAATAQGVAATGAYGGRLSIGAPEGPAPNRLNGFLVSVDRDLHTVWTRWFRAQGSVMPRAVVDTQSGLVVLATGDGKVELGGDPLESLGPQPALFLASFDSATGAPRWSRVLTNGKPLFSRSLVRTPSGNVAVAAMGSGLLELPDAQIELGEDDLFLFELRP